MKWKISAKRDMCAKSLQSCPTLCDPMDPAPVSTGLSRQEHCSGSPCPPPGDLPDPGTNLSLRLLQGRPLAPPGGPGMSVLLRVAFSWLCRAWGVALPWPGIKPTPCGGSPESEPLGHQGSLQERTPRDGPGHDFRPALDHGGRGEAQTCSRAACRGRAGHPARPSVRLSRERGGRRIRESDICHLLI